MRQRSKIQLACACEDGVEALLAWRIQHSSNAEAQPSMNPLQHYAFVSSFRAILQCMSHCIERRCTRFSPDEQIAGAQDSGDDLTQH
jgi:hypothetical protein